MVVVVVVGFREDERRRRVEFVGLWGRRKLVFES